MDKKLTEEVKKEADRIYESCTYTSKSHFNSSEICNYTHFILGIILIIISAVPLFYKNIESLALPIFILANIQTFIRPDKRSCEHFKAGNNYLSLGNCIREFSRCRILNLTEEAILTEIHNYEEHLNYLNNSSPMPFRIAYRLAQKGIKEGESEFKNDKRKK